MAQLDAARLRRWAEELDAEERGEKEKALEEKVDRLEAQLASSGLSQEDRDLLEKTKARLDALDAAATDDPEADDPDDEGKQKKAGRPGSRPTAKRTRPGRKSGAAYDWTVDDDGNVVKTSTAVIYTGADEPDEVELDDDEGDD